MKNTDISILITQNGVSYHFAEVTSASDGSLMVVFPTIKENTGVSQSIQLTKNSSAMEPILLSTSETQGKNESQYRISYHTSGQVNYHKMTFQPAFLEPLCDVHEKNVFFIYSFVHPEIAFMFPDKKMHANVININISELKGQRLDIVLSVCPSKYSIQNPNGCLISYQLYGLCVEVVNDNAAFHFSQLYKDTDCVKLRPHLDKFSEPPITKEQAHLLYKHTLYQTKDAIVLPPNGEGTLEIIFSVEMRIPPWLHIEFANSNFSAEVVKRETTHLKFKVFDRKHNQYIKKADDIKITQLFLDANIYEDDSIAPPNCI